MKNQFRTINFNYFSLLILGFTLGLSSCNNQPDNKTTHADFDKIDSLRSTFLTIEDSLIHTWNIMINDDNHKIKGLKRLVEEVVYAGGVDSTVTSELLTKILELKSSRYTMKTMADSDLIDIYDSSSNAIVNAAVELASIHPEFDRNIVMNELIGEINESEGKILFYRIDYDDMAKVYNQFLEENKSIMNDIDSDHERHPLPLFELPAE